MISARHHRTRIAFVVASAWITVFLLKVRAPDAFAHPQMWAEDAAVYWIQQYEFGNIAIFFPYAGYLQLLPRLAAFLASFFPYGWAPTIFGVWSIIVTAWSAATSSAAFVSPWVGLTIGATLLLPPHPGGEVFGNITNLQWLTAPTLAVIAGTSPPPGRLRQINQLLFTLIASLSGPFSIFLVPIFAWRLWHYKDYLTSTIAILAALTQLSVILLTEGGSSLPGHMYNPLSLTTHLVMRTIPRHAGLISFVLLSVCLIPARGRPLRLSCLLLGIGVLAATVLKFINLSHAFDYEQNGQRYNYIPDLMLLWIAVSMCFTRFMPIAAVWLLIFTLTYPSTSFQRQRNDEHWSSYSAQIGVRPVTIPIDPKGWSVTVPCLKACSGGIESKDIREPPLH